MQRRGWPVFFLGGGLVLFFFLLDIPDWLTWTSAVGSWIPGCLIRGPMPTYLPTSPSIYLLASCACALSAGWGVSCVCVWARGWLWGGLVGGWGWEGRSIPPGGWRRRRCICEGACSLSLLSLNLPSLIFAALDICLVSLLLSRGWWGGSSRLHLWCWLWLGWG